MDLITKDTELLGIVTDESFISSVRRASILGSDGGLFSDDDIIKIALYDAYPRILMRISLTRDKDNNPLFKGIGVKKTDYSLQFIKSLEILKSPPYSFGLKRVAISLTASYLIKSLPLNADLKFFDLGESLEKSAISDLEQLIGVLIDDQSIIDLINNDSSLDNKIFLSSKVPYKALFFSYSIDLGSIPPDSFDLVEEDIALYEGVSLHTSLNIPQNYSGVCYINMSYTGSDKFIKEAFIIDPQWSLIDICNLLTEVINEFNVDVNSNVIASLNISKEQVNEVTYSKAELYPDSTTNREKKLLFTIYPRVHVIELSTLNLSSIRNREVIHVDLRTINNNLLPEVLDSTILNTLRPLTSKGIDGIYFGVINNYYALTKEGPHSLIVEVDKGDIISTQDSSEVPINNKVNNKDLIIDTFYFRIPSNLTLVQGLMVVRVSTSPNITSIKEWIINIPSGTNADEIAKIFHMSFYDKEYITEVLGSLAHSNAVQMVSFIKTREVVRIIVDILEVPLGVEVATGNNINNITPYKPGHRSINIPSVPKDKEDLQSIEESNYNKPKKLNIGKSSPPSISPQLQAVRKKLEELDKCNYPNYGKCLPYPSIIRAGRFGWCCPEDYTE